MLYAILLGIVLVLNLSVALFVLLKNHKNHINISFSLFVFAIVLWIVTNFLSNQIKDYSNALLLNKLIFVFSPYISLFLLYFSLVFPQFNRRFSKRLLLAIFFPVLLLNVLTLLNLVISDITFLKEGGTGVVFGPAISLYVIVFLLYLVLAVIFLVRSFIKSSGYHKAQLQYLIFGALLFFVMALITNLLLPLLFNIFWISDAGPIFSLTLVGATSYAIVKHRLMDIRLILARTVLYFLLLGIFSVLYVSVILLLSRYILKEEVSLNLEISFILITLLVAITFQPLRNFLGRITNNLFYKSRYIPRELLYELGQCLNTTLGFEDVLQNIYTILHHNMHTKEVIFAVRLEGRSNLPKILTQTSQYAIYAYGNGKTQFDNNDFLTRISQISIGSILRDELEDENKESLVELRDVREWMSKNNISVVLPLRVKNEEIGAILVGDKLSGEAFSSEDISTLQTFALQAAIGIENILLFMHSRDFNQRLKSEVDQATSELQQKNRNLEVLRKMDSIIMTTLDPKEMSQKIVDTISWELGYDGALISIVDYKRSVIVPTAVSNTPLIKKSLKLIPRPMEEYVTPLDSKDSLGVQALQLKTKIHTTSLAQAFAPVLPALVSDGIQKIIGMKGVIIYPIMSKDQPLGLLTLATHKVPTEMSSAEHNLLDAFMDEVAIALENAYLYEEARSVNQALYESNKELIGLDKMKDEFVSIASHELRTPMTAINGYVWMLLQGKGGQLSEKQRFYLERVSQSTQRLINLVNDMLSVSRIESGRIQINITEFEVTDIVKSVYEELQIKADEKKLGFSYTFAQPSIKAFGDSDKVREVVTNLLGNALKFTEKGSITTHVEEKEGEVVVSVADTGRGVSKEDLPKLFKKFGRLDSSLSTVANTTGTGLGLYICKRYVESMRGHFDVQSDLGKGSVFAFTLPKSG